MRNRNRDPKIKKVLSYLKDPRSSYAKNNRAGRKSVRFRKAYDHRSYRKAVHQLLIDASADADGVDSDISGVRRKRWRKIPDTRLVHYLDRTWAASSRTKTGGKYKNSDLRKIALIKMRRKRGQYG